MSEHIYFVAERFKSIQGEGLYAGTPMAFIRFVGCSVSKKICAACDTDFAEPYPWKNGGVFTVSQLLDWVGPYQHICLTGGEPLDQDLIPLLAHAAFGRMFHIETSGTVIPSWLNDNRAYIHLCVSPKPGFRGEMIEAADELKIIVPGLGPGDGWPTLSEAKIWALTKPSRPVFIQPRNLRSDVDKQNLQMVLEVLKDHPELRLSPQLHKFLHVS